MQNRWQVIGINVRTGERKPIAEFLTRELALVHKLNLEDQRPRAFAGVTVEYGESRGPKS